MLSCGMRRVTPWLALALALALPGCGPARRRCRPALLRQRAPAARATCCASTTAPSPRPSTRRWCRASPDGRIARALFEGLADAGPAHARAAPRRRRARWETSARRADLDLPPAAGPRLERRRAAHRARLRLVVAARAAPRHRRAQRRPAATPIAGRRGLQPRRRRRLRARGARRPRRHHAGRAPGAARRPTCSTSPPTRPGCRCRGTRSSAGATRWTRPGHLVSNGAFTLERWRQNDRFELVRNPRYRDAARVRLDARRGLHRGRPQHLDQPLQVGPARLEHERLRPLALRALAARHTPTSAARRSRPSTSTRST